MNVEQQFVLRTGQTLILRPARPEEDAERTIAHLQLVATESDNLGFGPGEFQMTIEQQVQAIEQFTKTGLYLIGEVDGELASILTIVPGHRLRGSHAGEFGVTVANKYWGLGIGTKMMEYLLAWARETKRIRKINLRVRVDHEAGIALYKKMGFVVEGVITRNFFIDGQFHDSYWMGLHIDPPQNVE